VDLAVFSGPVVITLTLEEAEAVGRELAETLRLAHRARGQVPPARLTAFSDRLNAAAKAAKGRASAQASTGTGLVGGRCGPSLPVSDQPATLTVAQAAVLAEVDPRTVRKWIARRQVEAARGPGGAYEVDIASIALRVSERRRDDSYLKAA
jgi:hypothetical protein